MPEIEYEFHSSPAPSWDKYALGWLVREQRSDGTRSLWRRLHQTPRGQFFLMTDGRKRTAYNGPQPPEA